MMFAAALTYTNTFGRKGFAWEACDEPSKHYWRRLARLAWDIFNNTGVGEPPKTITHTS